MTNANNPTKIMMIRHAEKPLGGVAPFGITPDSMQDDHSLTVRVLSPLIGVGTINQGDFSVTALVVSLLGAIVLLGIVNLFRRGMVR